MSASARHHPSPVRSAADRARLGPTLDVLSAGVGLYSSRGAVLEANRNLRGLLRGAPDGERLRSAVSAVVRAAVARPPGVAPGDSSDAISAQTVHGDRGSYEVRAGRLCLHDHGDGETILVTVERVAATVPHEDALRDRWGLTRQEARVAQLLAMGCSNRDIADALAVSIETAKHHVAHVRRKFGARSRAEVAARILRAEPERP